MAFSAGAVLLFVAATPAGPPPGERVIETYPNGKPRAISYVVNFVPRERVEYDAQGHVKDLLCNPGRSNLVETERLCGFGVQSPVEIDLHDPRRPTRVAHLAGVKVGSTRFTDATRKAAKETMRIVRGTRAIRELRPDGSLETEIITAVDPQGRPIEPPTEENRSYYPGGQLKVWTRMERGVSTADWWYPDGTKQQHRVLRDAGPLELAA